MLQFTDLPLELRQEVYRQVIFDCAIVWQTRYPIDRPKLLGLSTPTCLKLSRAIRDEADKTFYAYTTFKRFFYVDLTTIPQHLIAKVRNLEITYSKRIIIGSSLLHGDDSMDNTGQPPLHSNDLSLLARATNVKRISLNIAIWPVSEGRADEALKGMPNNIGIISVENQVNELRNLTHSLQIQMPQVEIVLTLMWEYNHYKVISFGRLDGMTSIQSLAEAIVSHARFEKMYGWHRR